MAKRFKVKDLSYNFMPTWWAKNYGIKYGKRYYTDPEYRMQVVARVRQLQARDMADLLMQSPELGEVPVRGDFGNATTGAYVGCEVQFPEDDVPRNKHLPEDKLDTLALPRRIQDAYPYRDMIEQVRTMNARYGQNDLPIILPRGILNEAFLIEGDKILTDMYEEPEEATRILNFAYGLLEQTVRYNAGIGYRGLVRVLNCTVKLVSPAMYAEWLLPYDMKIFELAKENGMTFGIHHCGELTGAYVDAYRRIPEYAYLQIGFDSDLEKTISLFPEADLHYIFDPVYCMQATKEEVVAKTREILYQAGAAAPNISIGVGAIDYGTPMENLQAIHDSLLA